MHTINFTNGQNLSNYIKNRPNEFRDYISNLVDKFIIQLNLNITDEVNIKLRTFYQFICMYSIILWDLNTVKKIMGNAYILKSIVTALLINKNLKITRHPQLVAAMMEFIRKHNTILASEDILSLAYLHFDTSAFYSAVKYVSNIHCNEIE